MALVNTPARDPLMGPPSITFKIIRGILPTVGLAVLQRLLGRSETAKYWNLKTEATVVAIRAAIEMRKAHVPAEGMAKITARQDSSVRDLGIKGPIWISKYTSPVPPENADISQALQDVIKRLDDPTNKNGLPDIIWPEVVPLYAEWTGYRPGVDDKATLPEGMSEADLYAALDKDATAPQRTTVLYLHGGEFVVLDPASHRHGTRDLARYTNGRVYSVRYRLAPQHPFPAAVLDGLVAYLTLLYPPPGAYHKAVNANDIVLAGDSAGGNLSLAVTQVILDLHKNNVRIPWFGTPRPIPIPAGVAVNSPWVEPTGSLPAWAAKPTADPAATYVAFDYLPPAGGTDVASILRLRPPAEAGPDWPAELPRHFLYADKAFMAHPLVNLMISPRERWAGAPPTYVCCGWERVAEEALFFTQTRLHNGGKGVKSVVFEHYEAMPHCFGLILPDLAVSVHNMKNWAAFIRRAVERPETLRSQSNSTFTYIDAKDPQDLKKTKTDNEETKFRTSDLDPERLSPYSEADVQGWIRTRLAALVPAKS